MKICVTSICSESYSSLGEITHAAWASYCHRHGYDWHPQREPLSDRGLNWDKIILLSRLLSKYDLVLWVGCDTLVTNSHQTVDGFYEKYSPASLLVAADLYGLNTDVMLFRQSVWSEMLLSAVHDHGYFLFKNHPWSEQEAVIRFTHQSPYDRHVAFVPQKGFNSYVHEVYGRPSH